ncbi:mechanosensitive ion channel family protein [Streptococcus zalophi]|uniref:Mechanosensitive ion channel n=1 Tax=Streptococcus zalophi TaxID=640031 RepID=A0A934PA91_9STRE|nr:mechanosensitive ion channel domain-containing protein [Streptococcus zalophi]MBJ8349944.1 mechanosensitive ion channel [Streptococcus zalophi]MCR8966939.1 mechanosensitive ion channel family protein [Streptococcus zalophi]
MSQFTTYWNQFFTSEVIESIISKSISLIILIICFYIGKWIFQFLVHHILDKVLMASKVDDKRRKTLLKLFQNLLNYLLYFFLIYSILIILGVPVSGLLAGAGIAGVAIGLGAQGFLTDVVNGIFILSERQLDVGENVVLGNIDGIVTRVGIRTTQVKDFDGTMHFIPNRNITVVSNLSRYPIRARIDIPIFPNTDVTEVRRVIEQVNQEETPHYPKITKAPEILGITTLPNGQLVFRIDIFAKSGFQLPIEYTFYTLYQKALTQAGVYKEGELPLLHKQ